jgi:hypothetical protein
MTMPDFTPEVQTMETHRVDLEMTADQEAVLGRLRDLLAVSSMQEAVIHSGKLMLYLAEALASGKHLYIGTTPANVERLVLVDLEKPGNGWQWLAPRAHRWRRQLWVKGRRLLASQVLRDMQANKMTEADAAANWDLPLDAIREIILYCIENSELIAAEADEERQQLNDQDGAIEAAA